MTEVKQQIEGTTDNNISIPTFEAKITCVLPASAGTFTQMCSGRDGRLYEEISMISHRSCELDHSLWLMSDTNGKIMFYDFKEKKQIVINMDVKYMFTLPHDTYLITNDKQNVYSFPDEKLLFKLPSPAKHVQFLDNRLIMIKIAGDAKISENKTIIMDDKFRIIYTNRGDLLNTKHGRVYVFRSSRGFEFVDNLTWKTLYMTEFIYTSEWLAITGDSTIATGDEKSTTFITFSEQKPENECRICHRGIVKIDCAAACGHTCFHYECAKTLKNCPVCQTSTGNFLKLIRE